MDPLSSDIRVLHVLAPARVGGLERVVTMLAEGQRKRGVHVAAVLTPGDASDHPFIARLQALDIPVTPLVVGARNYPREYRSVGTLASRLRPGIIHTHGFRADVIAGAVARAHRISTVSTIHGFTGGDRYTGLYERVQCIALRRADAVIAVSRPLVNRLIRAGVPRELIYCLPNGFAPADQVLPRSVARQELGIRADAMVAGWVGRLSHEKGADVMLDALAECDPAWHLSVIGDGPERDRLGDHAEKLGIGHRVTWHGAVDTAASLIAAFDAFVLSSRTEGTPIALFEAIHAGVPVVATRVGGVPDVVTSAHALLVPPEHPRMIAHALEEIALRRSAAAQRSALARERLIHSFDASAWLAAVDAIYDDVLAKSGRLQRGLGRDSQRRVEASAGHG